MKMFEDEYLYECERAELLGLPKPDKKTFQIRRLARWLEEESRNNENLRRPETTEEEDNEAESYDILEMTYEIQNILQNLRAKEEIRQIMEELAAANRLLEQLEANIAERKTDSEPVASTSAIPSTSTEGAQDDEENQSMTWPAFMQLFWNFVYPKNTKK